MENKMTDNKFYLVYDKIGKVAAIFDDERRYNARQKELKGSRYIFKIFDTYEKADSYLNKTRCEEVFNECGIEEEKITINF